jgi:Ca-activated chloride channel family protein
VLFLIDTSGSMSGDSMVQAKNGLHACLDMLRDQDTFTMIRFADAFTAFTPRSVAASAIHIHEAGDWISSLNADGGTQMQPALAHALALPRHAGALRLIIFLTDGDVGNEDSLLALLADKLGPARLFAFGIGSAPNEFLMRRMAELGRGQSRFLRTSQDLEPVMADFFRTLESPVCTDVALHWYDATGQARADIECYPHPCPDVFADRPLQVVARLPQDYAGDVMVTGTLAGEPVSYAFPVVPSQRATPAISRLFGQQRVNRLMIDFIQADGEPNKQAVRTEIVDTALRHQLITRFTSRVAVEDIVARAPDGTLVTTRVAVPLPFGFEATATTDPLLALVGGLLLAIAGGLGAQRRRRHA